MNHRKTLSAVLVLALAATAAPSLAGNGKHFIFNLVGTGYMYLDTVPDIDGDGIDEEAFCFDLELINVANQKTVGSATDCLANIMPNGAGLALVGTTFFHLPQGTLVTRGNTTVQPVGAVSVVTPSGLNVSHITGASGTGNAVLYGTRRFAGATGSVRLSGMVDASGFFAAPGDPMEFDCLFVIDLD